LVHGSGLAEAAQAALARVLADDEAAPELRERLEAAIRLAGQAGRGTVLSPEELVHELGEGWVAEEALAVGLYAVLATAVPSEGDSAPDPVEHFKAAIAVAINHSGDSDSTGSIAGNILGAYYGTACLPADWLEALEAPEVIRGMAGQLVAVTSA
jgi:ADP-ribosylglycohydrolase